MHTIRTYSVLLIALSFFLSSCSSKDNPSTADTGSTLQSFKLANDGDAPNYDSPTTEAIWDSATPLVLTAAPIGDGFTGNSFPVTIRSVVSSQNIYFLVQYDDANENYLQQPLHFQGGDPHDGANWTIDKTTYEDGVSLIFESVAGTSGAKTFPTDGCAMLCHTTPSSNWDKGMFSESIGRYDLWHWHAGKGNASGYADDKVSVGNPNFAIQKDDDNAEIYHYNVIDDSPGYEPYLVAGGANKSLDKRYFIAEESAQTFAKGVSTNPSTGAPWATGDIVPSFSIAVPTAPSNDYFDVRAKGYYSGGKWTVKFQRKLGTTSVNDVQFASGNQYLFSFAIHNNTAPEDHFGVANKSFKLMIP
ncbi:MAG: ethylbenzene dehydrogenase-related protein [Bacteroidota bacterium]|nr:ethylbenzene dehydrogenase-related protein [Bacteroidota bacterium]MDP4231417.1 ethylbenzene dehydrogenase-related protein [Bacteroidota bacterium]MDP4236516.1 ethylbenzene dehydrogenase-related protein [Bacteroidota bacterium]